MKKLTFLSVFFVLLLTGGVHAQTASESLNRLKKYSATDVQTSSTKSEKEVGLKVQEMLTTIEQAVNVSLKNKKAVSSELIQELVRVSALTLQADPSDAATEILLPLYKKQKKAFEKALKSLPSNERAEFEDSLKNSEREESEGNG